MALSKSRIGGIGAGVLAAGLLVAVCINPIDRLEQVARWSAVLVSPKYAFIGDSLTKSGGLWGWRLGHNPLLAINLARNGADTSAIADQATRAASYRPHRIVVMAGTNDAVKQVDAAALRAAWQRLLAAVGTIPVIVFLPPQSSDALLNNRLREIDEVVRQAATDEHACIVDLNSTIAPAGILQPEYTTDGVHFTERTYAVWAAKLAEAAASCGERK